MDADQLRNRLAGDLKSALRAGAAIEVRTLRALMSAIDNAGAVDVPAETARANLQPLGPAAGATEAPRRELAPDDLAAIIEGEVGRREAAEALYKRLDLPNEAEALRAEIEILRRYRSGR